MFEIVNPTKILFGTNCLEILGKESLKFGEKAFIVSGKNFVEKTGLMNNITNILTQSNVSYFIFNEIEPQPHMSILEKGVHLLKENKCDMVIAIGGGSVIDSGKGIALLSNNKGTCLDLLDVGNIRNNPLPLIAIPTTAGTGSEVTKYSVFSDKINKKKFTIKSEKVCPQVAIVDPKLTLSLPEKLTVATAIDTLVHCIEGYLNTQSNSYMESLSLTCIKTIILKLDNLIKDPENIQLREDIMFSSTMGGIVINNARTGIIHTMAAAIEPYCNLHHGEVVGRILPKVMKFYVLQDSCKDKMIEMYNHVYCKKTNDPMLFVKEIECFIVSLFWDDNFRDQNISNELFDTFTQRILMDKGLSEISPIDINSKNINTLLKYVFDNDIKGIGIC